MKIVKLDVREDSDFEGIDAVALVENPAIEVDFMAFSQHEFASFNDYPQQARAAAAQGIKRNEKLNNKCGTLVGKQRAQQLAQGKNITMDTIKRMRSFLLRQKDNYDLAVKRGTYDACGYISYLLWGGPSALPWAEKKLRQAGLLEEQNERLIQDYFNDEENTKLDTSDYELYYSVVQDILEQDQKMAFSTISEDKQLLAGPLMVADKLIPRIDEKGDKYYVFFDEEAIKKLSYKLMKNKLIDSVNIEHDPTRKMADVSLVETWLVEDPEKDKSAIYGYNLPKGSWFGVYKVNNKKIWDAYIKTGAVRGFSVEGIFNDKIIMQNAVTQS